MSLLKKKKALVMGVANRKSIAWGIAKALNTNGASVALSCVEKSVKRVKKLAKEINCEHVFSCDAQKDKDIINLFNQIDRTFEGKLDIFVHSIAYADINFLGGEFIRITREAWIQALEISAYSFVVCMREARSLMKSSGGGSAITLTFIGARDVVPGYNIMGVAKAALECSVRYLAYDLGPENIRVNAIDPSPVRTISALAIEDFESSLELMKQQSPLMRNISVDEIGNTAVFLASNLSSGITGCLIPVDAGTHILSRPSKTRKKYYLNNSEESG